MKQFCILLIALLLATGAIAQWAAQNSGTTKDLYSVYFTDVNTGYAVGDSVTILKTIIGRMIWPPKESVTLMKLNSIYFLDSNTGYSVGDGGIIFISHSQILKK